ncbi:MAG: hypothetical protein WBM45_00330 [Woeseiaceae bacterium]
MNKTNEANTVRSGLRGVRGNAALAALVLAVALPPGVAMAQDSETIEEIVTLGTR